MKRATCRLQGLPKTSRGVPICCALPARMTTMRSAMDRASSWSCVTYTVDSLSAPWMRRISARISMRSLASRLDSGSSIRITGGSITMARAMATRCCWPPESWPGSFLAWPSSCTSASASATRRAASLLAVPRMRRPKPTLSCTLMCGNNA